MKYAFDDIFPRYLEYDPKVPVWCVTPRLDRVIHRFFDTCPVSPSGRYLALTRLPSEDKLPHPGDRAEIVLIDLVTGEHQVVAETRGWDTQLGAQVQWGRDDTQLFYNDVNTDSWTAHGVRMNPLTGEKYNLKGTVYMISPDGKQAISPCLMRIGLTQSGYGVHVPWERIPINKDAADDDGIYVTNTDTGEVKLLISLKEIVERAEPPIDMKKYGEGDFYGFHVKWNPQGDKIMFVPRYKMKSGGYVAQLITMDADGSHIHNAIPATEWKDKGGHHPNWCPDGEHVMMNLKYDGVTMRFVKARYDGSDYEMITSDVIGSGHPSLHSTKPFILTDAYMNEPMAYGDGTTPIRFIDLREGTDEHIIRMRTQPLYNGPKNQFRVDPHPVWNRDGQSIIFNACPEGIRKVFMADLSSLLI